MSSDRAASRVSWERLVAMTPLVIRQTVPMVPWNIRKLHGLDLAVQQVPVDDLTGLLDLPLWQENGARCREFAGQGAVGLASVRIGLRVPVP